MDGWLECSTTERTARTSSGFPINDGFVPHGGHDGFVWIFRGASDDNVGRRRKSPSHHHRYLVFEDWLQTRDSRFDRDERNSLSAGKPLHSTTVYELHWSTLTIVISSPQLSAREAAWRSSTRQECRSLDTAPYTRTLPQSPYELSPHPQLPIRFLRSEVRSY